MEQNAGKYLTFSLGKEFYGIPILDVKEIIGMMEITEVPQAPPFIKGVINLRGKIIPIMDLRLKFGMIEKEYNERTCIIWVEVRKDTATKQMGIVVDTVSEVVDITATEMEEPPKFNGSHESALLMGLGKVKDRVIMLLEMNELLERDEVLALNKLSS